MLNRRKIVYLGAFLHDIGKAIQRAGANFVENDNNYYGKHPKQGFDFLSEKKIILEKIFGKEDTCLLLQTVLSHHESHYFQNEQRADLIKDNDLKCFATMVSRADNFSSSERGENSQKWEQWNQQKLTPLFSVFQKVSLNNNTDNDQKTDHYGFDTLNFLSIFPKKNNQASVIGKLIDSFLINFDTFLMKTNAENFEYGLNYLVYNYLWCIPANTMEETPDVSLYDHLKTTSAIATCIYDYHFEKNELTKYEEIKNDSLPRFRLLVGDFSGIQKYIFDIQKQEDAGKRLRARSFLVQLFLEDVKMMVLKKFNLPLFNVIFQSGGKFFILLPNINGVEAKINEIQNEIDLILINRFNGEFSLNLALSDEFCGKPKKEEEALSFQNFDQILTNVIAKQTEKQKRPFLNYLIKESNEFSLDVSFNNESLCPYCRKFKKEKEDKCFWCDQDIKLGEKIKGKKTLYLVFSSKGEFELLTKRFDVKSFEDLKKVKSNEIEFISILNPETTMTDLNILDFPFSIGYVGNYVPKKFDFQDMARISCQDKKNVGMKMLGILKADVDNLGKIFSLGLKKENGEKYNTISRQTTLSRMLDLFFAGYLNELIKKEFPDCYLLYSGGDDLVILGPWDRIISLALKINSEFKRYTLNKDITLSAGIFFCKHNYPIFQAVLEAEASLEKVKSKKKNGICLLNQIIDWENFAQIYPKEANKIDSWLEESIEDKGLSVQFVRNLFLYGQMREQAEKGNSKSLMWQPLFAYNIGRNLAKKPEVREWAEKVAGLNKDFLDNDEKEVYKIISDNLIFLSQYALYRNRKD